MGDKCVCTECIENLENVLYLQTTSKTQKNDINSQILICNNKT